MPGISLGPFTLETPLAAGGMGSIWRGTHTRSGVEVALKVLTGPRAQSDRFKELFQNEVLAAARLQHPGVVRVLDQGRVPTTLSVDAAGELVPGSPYFAMEFIEGRPLGQVTLSTWAEIRDILLSVLDALAYAHARGVIHRDLKPSNILVDRDGRARLIDFGVAGIRNSDTDDDATVMGTPAYMAPEQVMGGMRRDQGPWTDIYALGCVAYELVSGNRPYEGLDTREVMVAQVETRFPSLRPIVAAPAAVNEWIRAATDKQPRARFQSAADAAWALRQIDGDALPSAPARPQRLLKPRDADVTEVLDTINDATPLPERGQRHRIITTPPQPDWRRPEAHRPDSRVMLASHSLFGARHLNLVGRERERDILWGHLRRTRDAEAMSALVIQGPTGVGKTSVVRWFCERSYELGAAEVVKLRHGRMGGQSEGLSALVAETYRAGGLQRQDAYRHLLLQLHREGLHDPREAAALVEILAPDGPVGDSPRVRFHSRDERFGVLTRLLLRRTTDRPVIVWIEDAHYGRDTLAWVRHVLASSRDAAPVLFVLTVRDEALATRPNEARTIEQLTPRASLSLERLPEDAQRALLRDLFGLHASLIEQVYERTRGNPLFATQMVSDWVRQGLLVPGDEGFELAEGASDTLPDSVHELWLSHVERALLAAGASLSARAQLERAATLGEEVTLREWRAVTPDAGPGALRALQGVLTRAQLANGTDDGFVFAHNMLVESLLRAADEAGRLTAHHRACAEGLLRAHSDTHHGVLERIARHLEGAQDPRQAAEMWVRAARARRQVGDFTGALLVLDHRQALCKRLKLDKRHPAWGEGWSERAEILRLRGDLTEAKMLADRVRSHGEGLAGWEAAVTRALETVALVQVTRRVVDEATECFALARSDYEARSDEAGIARTIIGQGWIVWSSGDSLGAKAYFVDAKARFDALGDALGSADAAFWIAASDQRLPDREASRRSAQACYDACVAIGDAYGMANAMNLLAETDRAEGRLDAAMKRYTQALAMQRSIGSGDAIFTRINIGIVLLERGQWAEALASFEAMLPELEAQEQRPLIAGIHCHALPCVAGLGDWAAWDHHFGLATEMLLQMNQADPDDAGTLEMAGDLAAAAGREARAREAYLVALGLWEALNSPRAAACRDKLDAIPSAP